MALFRRSETQKKYIYETPDNGKTITRRVPMGTTKEILVPTNDDTADSPATQEHGRWLLYDDLLDLGQQHYEEEKLRKEHPALQDAWDQYRLILGLVKNQTSTK